METAAHVRRDLLWFALVLAATLVALMTLNALPRALGGEPRGVVRYDAVAQVIARYRTTVWAPSTLPGGWTRRSSSVRVAPGDIDWAQLTYAAPDHRLLTACQTLEPSPVSIEPPSPLLAAGDLLQRESLTVAGRAVEARRLLLADGSLVHEVHWLQGSRTIMLRLDGSLEELLEIARAALESGS